MNESERKKRFPHLWRVGSLLLTLVITQSFLACRDEPTTASAFRTRGWTVRQSDDGERVTSLLGLGTKRYAGAPSDMALQFLREQHLLLGLQPDLKDLKVLEARKSPFAAHIEFQQVFNGLPVENGRIKINFDKEGRVLQVVSSYAPVAGSLDQAARSKEEATETAINEFLRTTPLQVSELDKQEESYADFPSRSEMQLTQDPKVDDVFFIRKERLRRAFKTLISAVKPFGIKEVITDAQDGAVLQIRDFVYDAVDGYGKVFIPNPVNSLDDPSLRDQNDSNEAVTADGRDPYFPVSLMALEDSSTGCFELRGPFVVLQDIEKPKITPPCVSHPGAFMYERNADTFEDVMAYYHIDRIQRYIQELGLGLDVMNLQLPVDAHGNLGIDTSHYVGSTYSTIGKPYIAFGDMGVDDAEDADVIAHEYGHAIQDNQAPWKYGILNKHSRAMGEGFGDYWAVSSFSADTPPAQLPCVMEWDRVLNTCNRPVNTALTADDFRDTNSNHRNGQIWSATLFEIFNTLNNKSVADKLILQSHFNVPDDPSFVGGADAILTADREIYGGDNIAKLCQVFRNRKIYGDSDCDSRPAATGNVNAPGSARLPFTYFLLSVLY